MKKSIRIGNSGGFWGDDLKAFKRQLEFGNLDYLTMDFLAEITMSILRKQQIRNPELGYVTDFVDQVVDNAELIKENNVRVLSNAGGINPLNCAKKIIEALKPKGIKFKIAVIDGDNLVDEIESLYPDKADFKNLETGEDFKSIKDKIQSANAYLGLPPLLAALESGADIIIAGRVTDTSITMAPMVYEFGWKLNDWDKLASGLVAGHIIECGAQSTGGNFTDWHLIEKWDNFGYPVVEAFPDGSFIVEKPEGTGGIVTLNSVKEQLIYEMGDPSNYISPDVVADFRSIRLEEFGNNRVKVFGVKGYPSTQFLKVSMAYNDGYSASGSIIISGGSALTKAKKFADIFWQRMEFDFEKKNEEYVGYNACHLNLAPKLEPNEILLRLNVYDNDKEKLVEFSKSIAPLILSGPPGVAVTGGRPHIINVMTYWPALIKKDLVTPTFHMLNEEGKVLKATEIPSVTGFESSETAEASQPQISLKGAEIEQKFTNGKTIRLEEICLARSGDKGDMANIGVIARSEKIYEFIKEHITAGVIKGMFKEHCKGSVIRHELDNLGALNFLLEASLDGGGTKSLMIDAQGKTFAQAFLNQEILVPEEILM